MGAARKKTPLAGPEERVTTYLAPGVRPDPYEGNEPSLDPDLAKARDEEAKTLAEVKVFDERDREDASIDPELVKAREAEAKRGPKVIGGGIDAAAEPTKKTTSKSSSSKK